MSESAASHEHESLWTDESWQDWDSYEDQVTVQIRFKTWLGAEDADECWFISSDGAAWSKEWLNRQLVELSGVESSGGCCGRGTYALDSREQKTEWGASGSIYDVILTLAQDQVSNALWLATGALGARLAGKLKQRRDVEGYSFDLDFSEEGARHSAMRAVQKFRDLSPESLSVSSVEFRDDSVMVVEVRDSSRGSVYTVEVQSKGPDVLLAKVRKITEPGA